MTEKLFEAIGTLIWITIIHLAISSAVLLFASLIMVGFLVSRLI